jgi:hypothetical protein
MLRNENEHEPLSANPGYAAWQLAKALKTSDSHADAATRERARTKAGNWVKVLEGLLSGSITVGSRQPLPSVPVWATPEVVTGGFVTGNLMAGGAPLPHELELAKRVLPAGRDADRAALNAYFLSESGLAELTTMLRSGCYDIQTPEEGALLVAAWLVETGLAAQAHALLDKIAPHFPRLRFFPTITDRSLRFGACVFLESVGAVLERLRRIEPNPRVMTEREAIHVWIPLYDRMAGLFLETVEGDLPTIVPDADGRWVSPETKRFHITGGWPCRHFAPDWKQRAESLLSEIDRTRQTHQRCGRPNQKDDSFARLVSFLRTCANDSAALTGRDVGMIRLILARHITRRGSPASEKRRGIRARQQAQATGAMHHEVAGVVVKRLATQPADCGLDDVETMVRPVDSREASEESLHQGTTIPVSIVRKVARCLCDTADVLVSRGIITSGEMLARVIPQVTAGLRAQAFDDPSLRTLYAAIYRAFRRRRSLLLFNLEKQVQIEELPWVAAMEPLRRKDVTARETARLTLKEMAMATLRAFPHAIIPNKLLQEFRALSKGAELNLPFVEELAADIFMDNFSPKFTEAARQAAALLDGSLYARYFDIDCAAVQKLPDHKPGARPWLWFERTKAENPFAVLCIARVTADETKRWDVARNGMVIEQSQILTTHNLAVLFQAFDLATELRSDLCEMALRCFRWICRRQQVKSDKWHAKLIMLKNTAYAWRQMIFYLSQVSPADVEAFLDCARQHLREQPEEFANRFAPALNGLALVHSRKPLDASAKDARRFLGWTQKQHWLLGVEVPKRTI